MAFDHFDIISPLYDKIFGRRVDREMISMADISSEDSLLDVGGGTGRVAKLFEGLVRCVTIADASWKMLYEAGKKGLTGIQTYSEKLPFFDGQFDRVIMVDALHHVADQNRTLTEMWRVLSPGGKLIIEEPDIAHFLVKLVAIGEKLLLMRSHFLRPEEIKSRINLLNPANIKLVRDKGIAWVIITKETNKRGDFDGN